MHLLLEFKKKTTFSYKLGKILLRLTILAGFFDVVENIALMRILLGNLSQLNTSISYYFASAKFILLLIAILYILTVGLWSKFNKNQ